MLFRPIVVGARISIADRLAQMPEPGPCPGELDTQNSETHWYYNKGRPRRNDHNDPDKKHRQADQPDDDSARRLVCNMKCTLDHANYPSFSERLAVALCS
jgi:hypothetical protein